MAAALANVGSRAIGVYGNSGFGITRIARVSSLAIPIFALLSNLPTVAGDQFVDCMNSCDKIEAELLRLVCYLWCACFASKK